MADIPIEQNNSCFLFKNNVNYIYTKFIPINKLFKELINIFFNNPNFVLMQQYLSYKNLDKIKMLLTELLYNKVTW